MTTYTTQPDGTDGIDTQLNQNLDTTNFATDTASGIGYNTSTTDLRRVLLKFDLTKGTNPPPTTAIISSAVITMECTGYAVTKTLALYRCLRNWVENQATWNVYSTGNNWGSGGCGSSTTDYVNTMLGSVSVTASGSYDITMNAGGLTIVQGWIDGTIPNYGLLLKNTSETTGRNTFAMSDNTTASYRPKLVVEYTDNYMCLNMFIHSHG